MKEKFAKARVKRKTLKIMFFKNLLKFIGCLALIFCPIGVEDLRLPTLPYGVSDCNTKIVFLS